MNLQILSDDQLQAATMTAAKRERDETISLLKHLSEIERRRLYSKFNCDSLHSYCVNYLKMSDPQAGRRVSASRLLNELPVIEEKVRTGSMTLTSLCQANTFFRKEAAAGKKLAGKEKLELINELEGKGSRRVEQILFSKSEQPEIHLRETVKQKTERLTQIKLLVDEETLNKLNRLKEIYSHKMPNATYAQIISKLATISLEKTDPNLKAKRAHDRMVKAEVSKHPTSSTTKSTPAPEQTLLTQKRSRHIPAAIKHAIWQRDRGRCTFTDQRTGQCCESRKLIEIDHVISFAHGGEHTLENLRLRCRAHNQRHAIEIFGLDQVSRFWRLEKNIETSLGAGTGSKN